MTRPTRWTPILIPLLAAACGDADRAEWTGTVRDSAGVEIVSNAGGSLWTATDAWTVAEELRIGTADGDPEYMFGSVAGVDVGSDGRIYVMDQQARHVRVFDAAGRHLRTIGKAGSGPGELSQAAGPVFVTPGDTVVVPDVMLQRITLFAPDGSPAGSIPLSMADGIPARWLKASNSDLIQQAMIMAMPGQSVAEPKNLVLRRSPRGELLDTLLTLPAGQTMDFSGGQPRIRLFAPEPVWAIGRDGELIHGNSSMYRFTVQEPSGRVVRIVEKQTDRQPISAGDQTEFRRVIRRAWEQAGMPPQAMEMMSQALNFAEHYPAYATLLGGPDGTIWAQGVQRPGTVAEAGGTFDIQDIGAPDWDIFARDGRYLGQLRMPPRFTPMLVDGDDIYGVLRDDMDVQYVARMALQRMVPPREGVGAGR